MADFRHPTPFPLLSFKFPLVMNLNSRDCDTTLTNTTVNFNELFEWYGFPVSQWFSWNIGVVIGAAAYGGICTISILTFMALQERSKQERRKNGRPSIETVGMFVFIVWVLVLCSGLLAVEMEASLPHPQLPAAYQTKNPFQNLFSGFPTSIVGVACSSLIHWAVEILFVWRSYTLYRNSKRTMIFLLSFAGLVCIVSLVSGGLFIIQVAKKEFLKDTTLLLTIFGGSFLASNLLLTHIIAIRLYLYRRHVINLVGREHADRYTGLGSIFIESGLFMNVILVLALLTIALKSNWAALPLLVFPFTEALSSSLVVFRVALGSAWSSGTANKLIAQHAVLPAHSTDVVLDDPQLSRMRYRATQVTQTSTAFRFDHGVPPSSIFSSSRQSSIRPPERCTSQISDNSS